MASTIYQLFNDHGFRLPREHGLTIIWTGSISLGLGISILNYSNLLGVIFSVLFATSILLSADSLMKLAKTPSRGIQWFPILLILLTATMMLICTSRIELLITLSLIGAISLGWIYFSQKSKQVSPMELMLGSMSIGFLALVIILASVEELTPLLLQQAFTLVWTFIGVSVAHTQYVETLRGKLTVKSFIVTWLLFLGSMVIPISLSVITVVILLPLIEPTFFVFLQTYRQELLKNSRRKIKTIGFQLMFRLWFVVLLILLFYSLIVTV
ncbi:MAG: hypothetical protein ACXACW_01100 [Candidatus Hodarchaeales archaeon]|jgi:hypothetical protein